MKRNDPQANQMMERMKWEVAKELGVRFPADGYWGKITSRECGKIGSIARKRVHAILEHELGEGRFTSNNSKPQTQRKSRKK